MTDPFDRLLSRYASSAEIAKRELGDAAFTRSYRPKQLTPHGHRCASLFLRSIAAMHEESNSELLIGLANWHEHIARQQS
jgi:hypothetical protein